MCTLPGLLSDSQFSPIESICLQHYRFPLGQPFAAAWDPTPRTHLESTLVRVRAGGLEGVASGEPFWSFRSYAHLFLGRNPAEIQRHAAVLDTIQFHAERMWPLEIALWDLVGQHTQRPLWQLLGGTSPRVTLYASTGTRLPAELRVEAAANLIQKGFKALKLRFNHASLEEDLETVRAVRGAVGRDTTLLVDANQAWRMAGDVSPRWDFATASNAAAALAELNVLWLEEPLPRHAYRELAELRKVKNVRIAGGEGNREFAEFEEYLRQGCLDVYQPDVAWSTGLWGAVRLAEKVRRAGAWYTPHTWGDGLVVLANLHAAAALCNAPFVEFPYDPPSWTPAERDWMLTDPLEPAPDGTFLLPENPGLGAQINWNDLKPYLERQEIFE